MALILAIETTTRLCSVALGRDGLLLAEREVESERGAHAEKVNVFVAEVIAEAHVELKDIDAIAVGLGPGSYTGSRIGLSAAKGLCYGLDKPIIGLNTLSTLVQVAQLLRTGTGSCWPMIDARRMEVFTQEHDALGKPIGSVQPLILDPAWTTNGSKRYVFGDGADKATELWNGAVNIEHLPGIKAHARAMFAHAEQRLRDGMVDDLAYLVPLYGKEANVTLAKKQNV